MSPPTPNQTRILWAALTVLAITLIAACTSALVWGLGQVLHLFAPVLWPLAIAAVLAYLLDPLVDVLVKREMKRQRAIVFVFGVAVLIVIGIGAAVLPRLVSETRELATKVPEYTRQIQQKLLHYLESSGWQLPLGKPKAEVLTVSTNTTNPADPTIGPAPPNAKPEEPLEKKLAQAGSPMRCPRSAIGSRIRFRASPRGSACSPASRSCRCIASTFSRKKAGFKKVGRIICPCRNRG